MGGQVIPHLWFTDRKLAQLHGDYVTGCQVIIPVDHHKIHDGDFFTITDVQNINTTTVTWMITQPNAAKWAHLLLSIDCTGEMLFSLYEGADRTGTTGVTAFNRNRNSAEVAGVTVHRGVSGGTTDGTLIYQRRSGATGIAANKIPGEDRGNNELILKQNTKYIAKIQTFANVYATFGMEWYENTRKYN